MSYRCANFRTAAILMVLLVAPTALAQSTPTAQSVSQPDLTSAELDWNPEQQFAWPDKSWDRDPWWHTATALVKAQLNAGKEFVPENKAHPMVADTWNRMLLKALMPVVTQLSATTTYHDRTGEYWMDLSMARFQSARPFEIRQTAWVWAIWFPAGEGGGKPTHADVLAMLPESLRGKFVPVTEPAFPKGTLRLAAEGLPPYLSDMLLFDTEEGAVLSGSKIMGGIAMRPSHKTRLWFSSPPRQQMQRAR